MSINQIEAPCKICGEEKLSNQHWESPENQGDKGPFDGNTHNYQKGILKITVDLGDFYESMRKHDDMANRQGLIFTFDEKKNTIKYIKKSKPSVRGLTYGKKEY